MCVMGTGCRLIVNLMCRLNQNRLELNMIASSFLRKNIATLSQSSGKKVLDAPCGSGRNALYLQDLGFNVTGVDRDEVALRKLADSARGISNGSVETMLLDFDLDEWPFEKESFDVVINIHYVSFKLLPMLICSVRRGGLFLMETFENRGENYLQLPGRGRVLGGIRSEMEILECIERDAGPAGCDAVTVRVLARKN